MNIQLGMFVNNPMMLTLDLASEGKYTVSPNPMVGAVLIKNNRLIGYGYHSYQGDSHAEVKALEMAGPNSKGATLYINLEPCCHYGHTPPCVDKLIEVGIDEIHIAVIDPNPMVQGKAIDKLRNAGIKVFIGECGKEAIKLNERFFHYMTNSSPFVIAKWAMSLDGKIATINRDSKWISSFKAREHSHFIRNSVDAILIGTNTAKYDNPKLTVRNKKLSYLRQPIKIVIDKEGRLDDTLKLFNSACKGITYVFITAKYNPEKRSRLEYRGVNFIEIDEEKGKLDLHQMLRALNKLSISSLLIEGGAITLASFLKANLINKFYCYISPKLIGGENSITPFGNDIGVDLIKEAKAIEFENIERIGDDLLVTANIKRGV